MFCNSDNSVYLVYDDDVCGIEISSLPIDVWHLSMLYSYVDILTGDRMIVGISNSVRLATGFGGFMPSHSLAPVMIPQTWVVTLQIQWDETGDFPLVAHYFVQLLEDMILIENIL